jgi:GAF domain-containing protein
MTTIAVDRLAEVFVELADTLVDEFDLVEFLQLVTARSAELLSAAAAGLLLADGDGQLQFMAASDENTRLLELFQLQNSEGPCLEAFRTAAPVINADLRGASSRWPMFAPRAVSTGFRSVHAFPLRLRTDVIGALNVFSPDVGRMEAADVRIMQALTDVTTIGILQERTISRGELLTEQLQGALNSRIVIEQAKGTLAQIHGVDVDAAFQLLRAHSRTHGVRLGVLAKAVVADPASLPALTTTHPATRV